jgi:hypothetical protein
VLDDPAEQHEDALATGATGLQILNRESVRRSGVDARGTAAGISVTRRGVPMRSLAGKAMMF